MDCTKCLYEVACDLNRRMSGNNSPLMYDKECPIFKDKSLYIELPCKWGQTVYCIRYDRARKPYVKPLGVLSITTYGKNVVTIFTTREDRLGLTAFLTQEEAEKALAERSDNERKQTQCEE